MYKNIFYGCASPAALGLGHAGAFFNSLSDVLSPGGLFLAGPNFLGLVLYHFCGDSVCGHQVPCHRLTGALVRCNHHGGPKALNK
jgi:hypothetical protein